MRLVTDIEGLSALGQCAHALGMAFGREALAATETDRRLRLYELFDRCFHGFRVAVALKLRLARAAGAPLRALSDMETLREPVEREPVERDPVEREPVERERPERIEYDRDREAASLPILLKTLNGVVAEAEALPGPKPTELPTLRELLARMGSQMGARSAAQPSPERRSVPPPTPSTSAPLPTAGATPGGVALLVRPPATAPSARSRLLLRGAASSLPGLVTLGWPATGPP